jgi:serine/threonine protein kinase
MNKALPPPDITGLEYIRNLGSGGFADVFLYRQHRPDRDVALKVLRESGLSTRLATRFSAEANAMAQLEHPHIVPVYAADTTSDGRPYIVMMYYPNDSLAERLKSGETFSVAQTLRIGIQIASALETAHRAGLLHRDIKPANILTSRLGSPGLTDFGIASRVSDEEDEDAALSPPWAPPEALTGQPISVASDVYSLGATLWNLLVGRSPFALPGGGDNSSKALTKRVREAPPPSTGRGDVPVSLDRLLKSTLAKDPRLRPATALELAQSLQSIEQELRYQRTDIAVAAEETHTVRAREVRNVEDATRLQTVKVVSPRLSAPAPPAERDVVSDATIRARATELDERTRLKNSTALDPADLEPEERRSSKGLAIVITAVVILVALALGVLLLINRPKSSAAAQEESSAPPDIVLAVPPGPVSVKGARTGPSVTFTWEYSGALDSDSYQVRLNGSQTQPVTKRTYATEVPAGTQACLEVKVQRLDGSNASATWSPKGCVT